MITQLGRNPICVQGKVVVIIFTGPTKNVSLLSCWLCGNHRDVSASSLPCVSRPSTFSVFTLPTTNIIFIHINLIVCARISLTNGILPQDISFQEHLRFH
eukprot:TRINITY_DN9715_c0_g2_i15.p1 TRINITY_DN9715_c0_g2~~TRINITY_DN9715_c0_g2_i15.p1  ORF type:complete len:100 (+),score=0.86 TRINITY_DN9715_c0_g2_i15:382-681(+)